MAASFTPPTRDPARSPGADNLPPMHPPRGTCCFPSCRTPSQVVLVPHWHSGSSQPAVLPAQATLQGAARGVSKPQSEPVCHLEPSGACCFRRKSKMATMTRSAACSPTPTPASQTFLRAHTSASHTTWLISTPSTAPSVSGCCSTP